MKRFITLILTIILFVSFVFSVSAITGAPGEGEAILPEETETTEELIVETTSNPNEEFASDTGIGAEKEFVPPTLPYVNVADPETTTDVFDRRYYNVTFSAYADEEITDYIDIRVKNINSGEIFDFRLYEINKYFKVVELPIGEYCLVSGTAAGDTTHKYPCDEIYFIVGKALNVYVPFNIGNPKEPYPHDEEDFTAAGYTIPDYGTIPSSEEVSDEEPSQVVLTPVTQKKSNFVKSLLPFLCLIIIFIVYVFRKKQNENTALSSKDDNGDFRI